MVHKFPDASHPGIAARARRGLPLEAVVAFGEGMQVGLEPHPAELFPAFHRIHRSPAVPIAVNKQHRTRCRPSYYGRFRRP